SFNWEDNEKSVFELSEDPDFKKVIIKKEVDGNKTETVIPEVGIYYWRSQSVTDEGDLKKSRPVKVIIEKAPPPAQPEKLPDTEVPIEWRLIKKKSSWNILNLFIS